MERRRGWVVLRVVLVGCWLVGAVLTWWTAPRQVSYERAAADVTAQRVTAYQWGDSWSGAGRRPWFGAAGLPSSGTRGPIFAWRTGDGRVYWADTVDFGEVRTSGSVDETAYSGPGAVGIAESLRAAGLDGRSTSIAPPGRWTGGIGIVLVVFFLGVLVAGPPPVLGTRWFWLWVGLLPPYGLGLVFWLFREHPWTTVPEPPGVAARDRGILGFGIGAVASILITVLLTLSNGVLGDRWVPLSGR